MIIPLLAAILIVSNYAIANEEGKELHEESCVACHMVTHDESFYTRDSSMMAKFSDLSRMVSMCTANFNLDWFPDEEKAVLDYLNTKYYKFKE